MEFSRSSFLAFLVKGATLVTATGVAVKTCPWRIAQLARTSAFSEFDTMPHARRSHPLRPFHRHLDETCKTGRRPIGRC
jgi:hypothetical protein